jgi:hypothetical protein
VPEGAIGLEHTDADPASGTILGSFQFFTQSTSVDATEVTDSTALAHDSGRASLSMASRYAL